MSRKINFLVLVTVMVAFFSSCSNNDVYDPTREADSKKAQYEAAFIKKYGVISPDQDWGFAENPTTRVANPNSNQWKNFTEVPEDITAAEKEKVTEWFKTHKNPTSIAINWSDFFVQHVSSSHANMDYLVAVLPNGDDDHINNFNASNGVIMLIQKSGTSKFGYNNTSDGKIHYNYTIQYIDGAYYVGFDFEATGQNPNQQEPADGYYSDWIVKITPAKYTNARRIMAEDLGEVGDFDFNDVVFDAAIVEGGDAVITLLAAGGTLPLYIGGESAANEVHNRFGVSTGTMVNTAVGKHQNIPPVIFRLAGYANKTIVDIPITVNGITLKAETGKAPGKLSVPTTVDWANETQAIDNRYPKFKDYVNNPEIDWWED
ncbi:MAG: hypothetical protein EGQ20_07790 [Bacteroides oleiciplenus]|nr:hypothetical protein [Bacteroides oleiciplenus]